MSAGQRAGSALRAGSLAAVSAGLALGFAASTASAEAIDTVLSATYKGEAWYNTTGGIDEGFAWVSNFDLVFEAARGPGTLSLYGVYNNGTTLSTELVGDLQFVSNIDNTQVFRLLEAWYQHEFEGPGVAIKAGVIDLNADFDVIEPALLMIHSSHGIGAELALSGENGPSIFPSTSLAASLLWSLNEATELRIGVFDAIPNDPDRPDYMDFSLRDGALGIAELSHRTANGFRIAVGAWSYTDEFDTFDPAVSGQDTDDGNWGMWVSGWGDLWTADTGSTLTAWLRYGIADNTDINIVGDYLGAGLVLTGFIAGRPDDQLGFGIAAALIGAEAERSAQLAGEPVASAETSIELTYRMQLTDWLALQPDVQYVLNPGLIGGLDDALVVGIRFELTGEW